MSSLFQWAISPELALVRGPRWAGQGHSVTGRKGAMAGRLGCYLEERHPDSRGPCILFVFFTWSCAGNGVKNQASEASQGHGQNPEVPGPRAPVSSAELMGRHSVVTGVWPLSPMHAVSQGTPMPGWPEGGRKQEAAMQGGCSWARR